MNYCPCKKNGTLTSPFEHVHQRHPDLRVLFRLFSFGFFRHMTEGPRARTLFESHTLTGIAIGRSPDSNAIRQLQARVFPDHLGRISTTHE
jgi:hypothetical protein